MIEYFFCINQYILHVFPGLKDNGKQMAGILTSSIEASLRMRMANRRQDGRILLKLLINGNPRTLVTNYPTFNLLVTFYFKGSSFSLD